MIDVLTLIGALSIAPVERVANDVLKSVLECQRGPGRRLPRAYRQGRPRLGPGSLRAHENLIGHCCRRHIGRTPQQLATRLLRQPHLPVVSTFRTMQLAQLSLRAALRRNEERVINWLRAGPYGTIDVSVRMGTPVGTYLTRRMKVPGNGYTATFRLIGNDYMPGGFQVITGWVSP